MKRVDKKLKFYSYDSFMNKITREKKRKRKSRTELTTMRK